MSHDFTFEKKILYDAGDSGITIPVALRLGSSLQRFHAKVDTGATFCVFQRTIGEQLGITIETGEKRIISTVTGNFNVFAHGATLVTEDIEFEAIVHFAEEDSYNRNILGRYGWLDQFKIGLVDYDGELFFSKYNSE